MRVLARLVAWCVGSVLGVRRLHVEASMGRAGVPAPPEAARAMYRVLAEHLLEVLGLLVSRRALGRVDVPLEVLSRYVGPGRGAVVATAHTGNWDLAACAIAARVPLVVVTKRLSVGFLDRVWQGLRARYGVRLVGEGAVASEAARALGRGELVAAMIDQVPMRRRAVTWAPFLGAPAPVDLAPALLAARAGVPLVVAFPLRGPGGRHRVHVAAVYEPPRRGRRAWAAATMEAATRHLEAAVLEDPSQWLWMHRRWTSLDERERGVRSGRPLVVG